MAGFLYFAELGIAPDLAKVRELGLGYAFTGGGVAPRQVEGATPSGRRGFIFADSKRVGDQQFKLDMTKQKWRKIPGKEAWVGFWNESMPTPAELARKEQLPGYEIEMADGHKWTIPVVRSFDVDSAKPVSVLPSLFDVDDSGQLKRGEIHHAHQWLWDLTEPAWEAMVTDGDTSNQAMLETASKIIGANYVVDVIELAGMLQVYSPQLSPAGIVALSLDYTTWAEWAAAKKKNVTPPPVDAGSSSFNGAADLPHATLQPALTS